MFFLLTSDVLVPPFQFCSRKLKKDIRITRRTTGVNDTDDKRENWLSCRGQSTESTELEILNNLWGLGTE
jgi:hypothetical protein